ncbi:MAG: reverse transcriptase domain-containing protein [Coriobacteriia bacterium]|nr:reverse transcriptase domain-containing protein [Coriobacteriia bacterium]
MSIIDLLDDESSWNGFFAYKQSKSHLLARDEEELAALIVSKGYLPVAQSIKRGEELDPPSKVLINKLGTEKKRTVYCFNNEVSWTLKHLAWLLYRYDDKQPEGCYSFRRNYGAHRAFKDIIKTPNISEYWCCKLDISNYFNSISIKKMLPILRDALADDPALCAFLEQLLTADAAWSNGELINEKRGVMAGTPTAPFLANLYLRALDDCFVNRGLPYARYSDDIILFARTEDEIRECQSEAIRIIEEHGLTINEKKAYIAAPGNTWEFLGMSYQNGVIDLSEATKAKLKGKIRRKARALRRWMLRKEATPARAQRAFIRSFNRKFYERSDANDLTWARWFFPLITTSESLREIDHYLQQYVRYIPTGRFSAANFRLDYQDMKDLGYRSLVHEYYLDRKARA